jgi:hypothetical protein
MFPWVVNIADERFYDNVVFYLSIQGDAGGKINNLGGDTIGHYDGKVHIHMCLILNIYPYTAVCIS